ncbi:MAG: NAD(P)H-binding protein [Pseudomonadota bacterium]
MARKVIVLGASGRFGRAAVNSFTKAGWKVSAFVRKPTPAASCTKIIIGDAFDTGSLTQGCLGHDVVVNCVNPPYKSWERDLPILTRNVICAASQATATVMIPGNIYNYGNMLPSHLDEATPWQANTKKGTLRIEMENSYRTAAAQAQLQTIILRGGDFFEGVASGNWFEDHIANKLSDGKFTYPGPLNVKHAWAYLPDMADAMAKLADKREKVGSFEEYCFAGYNLTGHELLHALEKATDRKLKISTFPWPMVYFASLFSKQIREVLEMRYLWQKAHSMRGKKLSTFLPDFTPTPLAQAMREMVILMSKT